MPELAAMLRRKSIDALSASSSRCGSCQRIPLPGERLHQLESGGVLCDLCFGALPEERRLAVSSRRVGASERPLAVARLDSA